ncbi:Protein of unknown function, partial [Gryllus bimaculatus]
MKKLQISMKYSNFSFVSFFAISFQCIPNVIPLECGFDGKPCLVSKINRRTYPCIFFYAASHKHDLKFLYMLSPGLLKYCNSPSIWKHSVLHLVTGILYNYIRASVISAALVYTLLSHETVFIIYVMNLNFIGNSHRNKETKIKFVVCVKMCSFIEGSISIQISRIEDNNFKIHLIFIETFLRGWKKLPQILFIVLKL